MAKSAGNFLTVRHTLIDRGIDPLAYRYAAFQTHYRNPMEYSDEGIQAAVNGLDHLRNQVRHIQDARDGGDPQMPDGALDAPRARFLEALNDDLNMPRAMAVVQEVLKSDMPPSWRLGAVLEFDAVMGFDLGQVGAAQALPQEIRAKVDARETARREKNWALSDQLRDELQALGYVVQDGKDGMRVFKK